MTFLLPRVFHNLHSLGTGLLLRVIDDAQGFIQDFSKRGGNHLTPPTYQETVAITNVLTARIHLWKKLLVSLNRCIPFCCNICHFAADYALKPPYFNTCADSKGGGKFSKGGGKSPLSPPPPPPV